MEKTIRIVIQTKDGFKFGYEKIVKKPDTKQIENPKPLKALTKHVNLYA